MAEEKKRVGFSIDFKDSKQQLDGLNKSLKKTKKGFNDTGKEGEASLNRITLGMKSVFQNITTLSTNLRKGITSGQKISRKQLKETLGQAKTLEGRLNQIHSKTSKKFEQAEGRKRSALKATLKAQQKAVKGVQRVGDATAKSLKQQEVAFGALGAILTVKVSKVLRDLVKESTLLAARNEVLGTAMMTVGNNAGISNAELERTEMIIRRLGISINDTRELISRFSQAQLGMKNATKLASAAQDLAAGSTLGSSEALRIMTQSILSLLPRQLRQFGVVVNLNQVYKEQSKLLNKSVDDLTSLEKRQGLLNKIFEESAKRAGAYSRSMEDSGKILTTLSSRIIPDTLSMLGDNFLPVLNLLVFGFKDLLEWVQAQEGGFKTFIATVIAVAATITTLAAGLVTLSGTLGFVKAGFIGAVTAAKTTLLAMGPLVIAITALGAALVLIPKLFEKTATAQETALSSAKGLLNIEIERLTKLEDLRKVLESQSLTEEDLRKIIQNNVKAHKELIPLLKKEKVTREDLLGIIDKEIVKNKEVLAIMKERARFANKEQLKILEEQQRQTNSLITALDKLQKKYGEGKIPVLVLVAALKVFQKKIEAMGGTIDAVGDQMREFADENDGGMQNLIRASQRLGERISGLKLDAETGFGTAAKITEQSASDMMQALKGLEQSYEKLQKKAIKKVPFAALAKEQVAELKRIDDALKARLISEEDASDLRLKNQKVFHERVRLAELKFREQLDSIGKTALQKIEAKRQRQVEINKGSALALEAIEKIAATARNAVYEKMWEDRLNVVKDATDVIAESIRVRRDLSIEDAKREADLLVAQERTTIDMRIQARQDFYDRALNLLSISQGDELAARQQHNEAVGESIQELYNKGVINEEQFNEQLKALSQELKSFQQQQITERITFLKSALSEMLSEEVKITENIKNLDQGQLKEARGTEDALRTIRQEGQTDYENRLDERKRATKLLAEGERALYEGNFARVKEISENVKSIALANSKEIVDSASGSNKVLISADNARKVSIKSVKAAGELLRRSFVAQRAAEVTALETVKEKIDAIQASLKSLLEEKKQIEISVKDEATSQIASIQKKLDNLKDKTITVTVYTRNVSVGGGAAGAEGGVEAAAGGPVASAEGDTGFAKGAVDIKGPGSSFSDSIVAFLSNGESVINAAATKMFAPLLEVMNADPAKAKKFLTPGAIGGATGEGQASETNTIGDVHITLNGVDSKDVQNINWRKAVREQIGPELKRLNARRTSI